MRRERKYHYIYKTTCKVTEKFYVGMHSTDNLEDGYMGSGKRLWRSIHKHGIENHEKEILEFLPNRSSLKKREKEIVNEQFLEDQMCMNLQIGGGGGISSKEHKQSLHKGAKEWLNCKWKDETYRKNMSNKSSEKMSNRHKEGKIKYDTFTGKTHSEETKQKIGKANSEKQNGKGNSQYGTRWITNGTVNKKIKRTEDLPNGWSYGRK